MTFGLLEAAYQIVCYYVAVRSVLVFGFEAYQFLFTGHSSHLVTRITVLVLRNLTAEGEDPEDSVIEEKELLSSWIQKAKLAESLITGENPNEIPDERFFTESEGEVKTRLVSIAQEMPFDKGFDVYVIGNGLIPNGISLKEQFGEYIRYSNTECDHESGCSELPI